MPLVIPANFYECAFIHTQAGTTRQAVCTLGVNYVGADFATDAPLMGGSWTTVLGELSNQVRWVRFTMRSAAGTVLDLSVNVLGGNTDPCASYQNAYLVKKVTGVPGRSNQGRMYLPGVSEVDVDPAGVINAAQYDPLQANLNTFLTQIQDRNFEPVILHQERAVPSETPLPVNINAFNLDPRVATQRHRLRG